ncbi:MAG: HD domain-containing protein [Promethearchaeota archaeon]
MPDKDIISEVIDFALKNSEKDDIHGFSHVERVYNTCIQIGKKINANLLVLKIAALLHDIGRINEKNNVLERNHAENSAQMALDFLTSNNYDISKKELDNIIHSIKAHSYSNKVIPETLEAKILSDADKLDALGSIGLYRTIGYTIKKGGGINQVIEHLEQKIMKLKNSLYLEISSKIAEEREKIILNFYDNIIKEKN